MRTNTCSALLAMGLFASSCAFDRGAVISETVGPPPAALGSATTNASDGTLVVYSSFDVTAAPPDYDASMQTHTPYDIYTLDGELVGHVRNHTGGRYDAGPDAVALPAGNYKVSATAQEYGRVVVPVQIVAGKTTTVHLDSNEFAPAQPNPKAGMVRLPDGQLVGWPAAQP